MNITFESINVIETDCVLNDNIILRCRIFLLAVERSKRTFHGHSVFSGNSRNIRKVEDTFNMAWAFVINELDVPLSSR